MVGFEHDKSKKSIPIGSAVSATDPPNANIIDNLNCNPRLHIGNNYILSTEQDGNFSVAVHDVDKYIHAGEQDIKMNFYKALMYVSTQKTT